MRLVFTKFYKTNDIFRTSLYHDLVTYIFRRGFWKMTSTHRSVFSFPSDSYKHSLTGHQMDTATSNHPRHILKQIETYYHIIHTRPSSNSPSLSSPYNTNKPRYYENNTTEQIDKQNCLHWDPSNLLPFVRFVIFPSSPPIVNDNGIYWLIEQCTGTNEVLFVK